MQNEKHVPPPRRGRWSIRNYWQSSILLLMAPTFHSDQAVDFSFQYREPVVAAVAHPNAHAHNDYLHDRPLWEALSKGFTSIETDVHLVGGELYLGHWLPQMFPAKTLRDVYLEPLSKLLARQNGKIYPNYGGVFYLMVDVKTDSLETFKLLRQQLLKYPIFQCNPHFQVFISGNRAVQHILSDAEQVTAVDGRLPDLGKSADSVAMPVVSDNFRKHFKWRGKGAMPEDERAKLQNLANEVHRQGKKLRFWAIPDQPNAWATLLEAGVDLISTDDLEGARLFFANRSKIVEGQFAAESVSLPQVLPARAPKKAAKFVR